MIVTCRERRVGGRLSVSRGTVIACASSLLMILAFVTGDGDRVSAQTAPPSTSTTVISTTSSTLPLVTTSTPPTTTGALNDIKVNSESNSWIVAMLSALFGAVATIAIEALLRRRSERTAYDNLLGAVAEEVRLIKSLAETRSSAEARTFELYERLPSLAWDALMSSSQQWRLASDKSLYAGLRKTYQASKEADGKQEIAWQSMSLALQATDPTVAEQMTEYARTLQHWPYEAVTKSSSDAVALLQRMGI